MLETSIRWRRNRTWFAILQAAIAVSESITKTYTLEESIPDDLILIQLIVNKLRRNCSDVSCYILNGQILGFTRKKSILGAIQKLKLAGETYVNSRMKLEPDYKDYYNYYTLWYETKQTTIQL